MKTTGTGTMSLRGKPCQDILCQDLSGETSRRGINPDKEEFFVADINKDRFVCRQDMHLAERVTGNERK